jgi:hypothetical protein
MLKFETLHKFLKLSLPFRVDLSNPHLIISMPLKMAAKQTPKVMAALYPRKQLQQLPDLRLAAAVVTKLILPTIPANLLPRKDPPPQERIHLRVTVAAARILPIRVKAHQHLPLRANQVALAHPPARIYHLPPRRPQVVQVLKA